MKIVKLAVLPLALLMLGGCTPKETPVSTPTPTVTTLPYIKGTGISLLNQSITAPTGETISLIPSNADHLTVISLWCPSCFNGSHAQLQELANLHCALGKHGVRVVVVAYDTPSQEISEAIKNMGLTLDIGTGNKPLYNALNITSIPTTWYVDSAGTIVKTVEGFEGLEEMYADIEEISRSFGGPEGANLRISTLADPIVTPTPAAASPETSPTAAPTTAPTPAPSSEPTPDLTEGGLDHSIPPVTIDATIPIAVTPTLSATPQKQGNPAASGQAASSTAPATASTSNSVSATGEAVPLMENNAETPTQIVDTRNEAIKTETAPPPASSATATGTGTKGQAATAGKATTATNGKAQATGKATTSADQKR